MCHVKTSWCAALLVVGAVGCQVARGQVITTIPVEHVGTIAALDGRTITVKTNTGNVVGDLLNQRWTNQGPALVELQATEKPDFLQPGMIVRFDAELAYKKSLKEKTEVVEMTVLIAGNPQPMGRPPQGAPGFPGVGPGRPPLGGGAPVAKEPAYELGFFPVGFEEDPDARTPPELAKYTVVGRVSKGVRRGSFTIEVPSGSSRPKTIRVPTAEDATVHVRASNLALARPGDQVHVKGFFQEGTDGRSFWATHVNVTRGDGGAAEVEEKVAERKPFGAPDEDDKDTKFKGVILKVN